MDKLRWVSIGKYRTYTLKLNQLVFYCHFKLVYYINPPDEEGNLTGLAKLCYDVAENIRFVSGLSVGEQLEYGLFWNYYSNQVNIRINLFSLPFALKWLVVLLNQHKIQFLFRQKKSVD